MGAPVTARAPPTAPRCHVEQLWPGSAPNGAAFARSARSSFCCLNLAGRPIAKRILGGEPAAQPGAGFWTLCRRRRRGGASTPLTRPSPPFPLQMGVSPDELEELEEVQSWLELMADLEGMEQDHLIELSLRHADKSKIAQIKAAAMSKHKHKAIHKHKAHRHAA